MKIVLIGLGTIGKTVLKSLSGMEHTITIIDEDKDKVEGLIEKYDVFGVAILLINQIFSLKEL